MSISLDKLTGFHHNAVNLRSKRMEIIAGNLANANTPGYKARDIDFQQALKAANANIKSGASQNMVRTHEKHISGKMSSNLDEQFRIPNQPDTGDGNTVEVQVERNAFLDNGMRYQASLQFLDGKFKSMKKALSGGQQ